MKRRIGLVLIVLYLVTLFSLNIYNFVRSYSITSESEWYQYAAQHVYMLSAISLSIIALLVWLEADHLTEYHLDRTSLLLLIIFGPFVRTTPRLLGELPYLVVIWVACFVILIALIRYWKIIPRTINQWSVKGVLIIGSILLVVIFLESLQSQIYSQANTIIYNPLLEILRRSIYNLAAVSTVEEILFRGFLWGFLTQLGWNEKKVFWTQAFIFWLGHFSGHLETSITYFVTLPLATYIFSQLARNTKQVFTSVVVHTIFNVIVPVLLTVFFIFFRS